METQTHKLADYYTTTYSSMVILECTCGHTESSYMGLVRTHSEAAQEVETKMLEHMGIDEFPDDEL